MWRASWSSGALEFLFLSNSSDKISEFRQFILDELHEGHPGIFAIKSLAHSSVWWPSIDSDLETKG